MIQKEWLLMDPVNGKNSSAWYYARPHLGKKYMPGLMTVGFCEFTTFIFRLIIITFLR
jgi:hypothetical protein